MQTRTVQKTEGFVPQSLEKAIAEQMNLGVEFSNAFLHPQSGQIYRVHDFNLENSDEDVLLIQKCVMLPSVSSQDTYLWMIDFAATVHSAAVRQKLDLALKQIGAIWKFRNVLYHHPQEAQAWENFNKNNLRQLAREWLLEIVSKS